MQQQQAPSDISKIGSNGIERLKKRVGNYRQHHHECRPRYEQSFSGVCEQQSNETAILQKRYEQNKAKKAAKKADKKQPENSSLAGNLQGSIHVVSIFPNELYLSQCDIKCSWPSFMCHIVSWCHFFHASQSIYQIPEEILVRKNVAIKIEKKNCIRCKSFPCTCSAQLEKKMPLFMISPDLVPNVNLWLKVKQNLKLPIQHDVHATKW